MIKRPATLQNIDVVFTHSRRESQQKENHYTMDNAGREREKKNTSDREKIGKRPAKIEEMEEKNRKSDKRQKKKRKRERRKKTERRELRECEERREQTQRELRDKVKKREGDGMEKTGKQVHNISMCLNHSRRAKSRTEEKQEEAQSEKREKRTSRGI